MSIAEAVKAIIVQQLGVDEDMVVPEAKFQDDLGAEDVDLVELISAIEENFGFEIPDDDALRLTTVGSLIEYVEKHAPKD